MNEFLDTLKDIKNAILVLATRDDDALGRTLTWMDNSKEHKPILTLSAMTNVVFEDPSKPSLTAWRNRQLLPGDQFLLNRWRATNNNAVIFRGSVIGTPMRDSSGVWSTVEFRLSSLKDETSNASEFLSHIYTIAHRYILEGPKVEENVDRGELWGSW